jgi:hypothetical protein
MAPAPSVAVLSWTRLPAWSSQCGVVQPCAWSQVDRFQFWESQAP